jgi:hypothetical protein
MKRILIALMVIVTASFHYSFCQDSTSTGKLTFSINALQSLSGELSLYAEYQLKKKTSLGVNAGIIFPIRSKSSLTNGAFSVNDNKYPFFIYNGYVARLYLKFYSANQKSYLSPLLMYKNLSYDHYNFVDRMDGGHGEDLDYYNRSETAQVFSIQLLWGKEKLTRHFLIDKYIGLGFRERHREYYTYSCESSTQGKSTHPCSPDRLGFGSQQQFFPEFHLGFRIGLRK